MIDGTRSSHDGLVTIKGVIRGYQCSRRRASFVLTTADRSAMGMIAIAAGAAGLSGPAISTAANATDAEEEADYLEFELNGQSIKGWVWRSPFKEGDEVEVAAQWSGRHYEVAGIVRPTDRTIALYPHCSRGRTRHIRNAMKWWVLGCTSFNLSMLALLFVISSSAPSRRVELVEPYLYMALAVYAFFGLMTMSLARKWMPFVNVAERVFKALGLLHPGRVDLVKSSKALRTDQDPGEFGTFYFRY